MQATFTPAVQVPLKIIATGSALPATKVTSSSLDVRFNKRSGHTESRSGIVHRFHADHGASQIALGADALHDALQRYDILPDTIDLLIYASAIPYQALPYSAAHLLKASPLTPGIATFDINASCVSFIAALQVAGGLLNTGAYRRVAIVSTELASRGIDWSHEESSVIFGDGAACAIVEQGDGSSGIRSCLFETYPEGLELCQIRAGGTRRNPRAGITDDDFLFHMDGKRLFRQAASVVEGFWARLLNAAHCSQDELATVVPHQASHLSLEHMRRRLRISSDVLIDIYRHHGNQVSASIPTALHYAMQTGRITQGRPVALVGTAAGLTLGGMVLMP